MAAGDVTLYSKMIKAGKDQSTLSGMPIDYNGDTLKLIILDDAFVPDADDNTTQEHLDDISASEVSTGGGYTGAITLSTVTVTNTGDVTEVNAANVSISADGSGFTDGGFAVVYKDTGTPSTSPLICVVDFGGTISIVTNDLNINWGSGQLFTVSKA